MLITASLWLLMSVGYQQTSSQNSGRPSHVVDRFPDEAECKKVAERMVALHSEKLACLPATVVVPPQSK